MILQQPFAISTSVTPPSYLVNEDFEGAGTPTDWATDHGSPDFDYSVVPLVGLQSLRLPNNSAAYYTVDLDKSEVWFKFYVKLETLPASQEVLFSFADAFFNFLYKVNIDPGGTLNVKDQIFGNIDQTTVDALSTGTVYNIWGHYNKGSGSNAVCEVSFDTVGNPRPNAGNKYAGGTNGTSTNNVSIFFIGELNGETYASVFDNVQIDDVDSFA